MDRTFRTSEVLRLTGIPVHKLYYLERKGYVSPHRIPNGDLEMREYTPDEVRKVQTIWKYLSQGFKHRVAYSKALEELGLDQTEASESDSWPGDPAPALSARRHGE